MLGVVFSLTLLDTAPLKKVEVKTEYLDYCTRNIQSFGLSFICVVSDIDEKRKRYLKLASNEKTIYVWVVDLVFLLVTVCTCD